MTPELRRRAYSEAAALLSADMDAADISAAGLSEEQEWQVREFIRTEIVQMLERHALPRRRR